MREKQRETKRPRERERGRKGERENRIGKERERERERERALAQNEKAIACPPRHTYLPSLFLFTHPSLHPKLSLLFLRGREG